MNDDNIEVEGLYVDLSECSYLIDLELGDGSELRTRRSELQWEEVGRLPFLDTSKSTGIGRAFLLPSSRNNIFAKYVLLRRGHRATAYRERGKSTARKGRRRTLILRDIFATRPQTPQSTTFEPSLALALALAGFWPPLATALPRFPRYSPFQKGVWLFWASKEAVLWAGLTGKWRHCFYPCMQELSLRLVSPPMRHA